MLFIVVKCCLPLTRCLCVFWDESAPVGFGDSVRSPLPLSGKVFTDVSGAYRIVRDPNTGLHYFQKRMDGNWMPEFVFTLQPRELEDFQRMNVFQQTSSDSHFTRNRICFIATPTGRLSMSGASLIENVGSNKTRRLITSDVERKNLLQRYFGIHISHPGQPTTR